jgi:lysine N6-hydroxylase
MKSPGMYDIIAIGIGPFNLGLAALANKIPILSCKFFDSNPQFDWHPGMLLPSTRLQVPFYADLVTLADPTSPFTYFNFLKSQGRMFRFAISENNFVTRFEYNQYCQWVVGQLPNLHFGMRCEAVHFKEEKKLYEIYIKEKDGRTYLFQGKIIVVGAGTVPSMPDSTSNFQNDLVFHSSEYLFRKQALLKKKNITLIGSGQSAAEIFYDLLQHTEKFESLSWFTSSGYIFPMDNSKFAFEMTSPDYINYFYDLPGAIKEKTLSGQNRLYKGVNKELIDLIYEQLYIHSLHGPNCQIKIHTNTEFDQLKTEKGTNLNLQFYHKTNEQYFEYETEAAIFATGYKYRMPEFLDPLNKRINRGSDNCYFVNRNYSIDDNNSIFVQNADLHSHGFNSADLGLGPFRNAAILNSILGYEHFKMEKNIAFQRF